MKAAAMIAVVALLVFGGGALAIDGGVPPVLIIGVATVYAIALADALHELGARDRD